MAVWQRWGGGGNNPCGAYYPKGGPLDSFMESGSGCKPGHYFTETGFGNSDVNNDPNNTTRGHGICCDIFKRVSDNPYSWQNNEY